MIYQVPLTATEISFVLIALAAAKQEIAIRCAPENYDPEVDALIEKVRTAADELDRTSISGDGNPCQHGLCEPPGNGRSKRPSGNGR